MSAKPILYYFDGRGRIECVRWVLAAAGVDFEEIFVETREDYEKLLKAGDLMFQQIPMVEIDGMKLVQTNAIMNYIAEKYNMHGKNLKEKVYIDMYVEGTTELLGLILSSFFLPEADQEKQKCLIKNRALNRYFPVYNKVLGKQDFLVGNQLSLADVQLLYAILSVEEFHGDILQNLPILQAFKKRMCEIPTIKKFLQPGSKRKPMADAKYLDTVRKILLLK
ncbi:glutathione S-transferase 3-like [Pseudophryne corroboree]|uniref:glutathione S-transferase 3-like n=1 Tax=Pseudophryne corroboree TaxID=495146 RepID=UPI003082116B